MKSDLTSLPPQGVRPEAALTQSQSQSQPIIRGRADGAISKWWHHVEPGSRSIPVDLLLPASVGLWAWSVLRVDTSHLGGLGLVTALPITYFSALGLLILSAAWWLASSRPSSVRLTIHAAALALMLYATAPAIYSEPRYAWLYKHVGVVQYIAAHGHLGISNDIYQDWPGFFALAAWFDRLAGLSNPLAVAAWAQLFFNLLDCLVLGLAMRALHMTSRERWLSILIFLSANWVAQDYFSPQAAGFVLSLGVIALVLRFSRSVSPPAFVERVNARLDRLRLVHSGSALASADTDTVGLRDPWLARAGVIAVIVTFVALVFVHELSPYVVIIQLTLLTIIGRARPVWLAPLLLFLALLYFAPHFSFVNRTYGLLASIGNFFSNARPPSAQGLHLSSDQTLVAYAARLLSVMIWVLALVGIWRRVRTRRPVLVLSILAFSPFLLLGLQAYGGEALLRVELFSLPWSACLAASALSPRSISSPDRRWVLVTGSRNIGRLLTPAALMVAVALFLPAYFGADQLNTVSPGDLAASSYLETHGAPGIVLYLDQDFPINVGARYYLFPSQTLLGPGEAPGGFALSSSAVGTITFLARDNSAPGQRAYFVATNTMLRYALAYGLTSSTSLTPLEQALDRSPVWHVFYRRGVTVIYELDRD